MKEEKNSKLPAEEQIFYSYFNSNPMPTFVWVYNDNDFVLVAVNDSANRVTGNKAKTFVGLTATMLYPDIPLIKEKLLECYQTKNISEFEIKYKARSTQIEDWIKFTVAYAETNRLLLYADITTQQRNAEFKLLQAKERAEESEEKYRAMYENAPLAYQSLDADGNFLDVNPKWLDILGYQRNEVVGSWFGSYLHPDSLSHFKKNFPIFKAKGNISGVEFKLRKKDNSYIHVSFEGSVGYTTEGKFRQTYCVFKDITSQKFAEEALKQSEILLNETQHVSKVGGWEWDVRQQTMNWTSETYVIHDINPKSINAGSQEHIAIGLNCYQPSDRKTILDAYYNCINNGVSYDLEFPFTTIIGNKKWVRTTAKAVYEDSRIIKVIGNIMDITDQKRAVEEHLQRIKLEKKIAVTEESLRFKQNFLANMSHEMRTPLTGILGMAEILKKTKLDDEQNDYLATILQSGENLRAIINNVLDFSKIEAGKVHINKHSFPFTKLPEHAESLFGSICRKPIRFESTIDPALPAYIHADEARIGQIISNLISNAVKFTKEGVISFKAQLLSYAAHTNETKIKILISDTGKGINEITKEKLFKPFSQIEDDESREYEGTGLGLSICKELVKMLDGEIGVESTTDKGSTFWFTFVTQQADISQLKIRTLHSKKSDRNLALRILLAEDKAINQKVITLLLTSLGHNVTIAQNGADALEKFKPGEFDLILMDIQMPVMDGIKATQLIREKYKNLPPIIGLSANAFEGDREKYMDQGLDEYLIKPLKTDEFHLLINKFFQ